MSTKNYIRVDGVQNEIDFDAHYTVKGYKGIAFFLLGWKIDFEPRIGDDMDEEFDEVPNHQRVIAVMVGDDRKHEIDINDLTLIPEEGFCRSCGQVGCGHNVYS